MKPRVLLSIPIYASVEPDAYFRHMEFHRRLEYARLSGRYDCRTMVQGPRAAIRVARNDAVSLALEHNATHLMFLDDDILPPPNVLDLLLEVDRPIVGALCHRNDGFCTTCGDGIGAPAVFQGSEAGEWPWLDHPASGAFECWAVGTGAMLIKTEVFRSLADDCFYYERTRRTMDVNFCRDARAAGYDVWCSADARVKQLVAKQEAR